ncbi:MAG: YbaB/EbfC family nucleoid-associated protein [Patescibacteria group bacterium]
MSFFDKAKQMKQMLDLKKQLESKSIKIERDGITVVVDGKLEIIELILNPELSVETQARKLKSIINDANKQMQVKMAQEMKGMGLGF